MTIQVYAIGPDGAKKVGFRVDSWADAKTVASIYPNLCRSMNLEFNGGMFAVDDRGNLYSSITTYNTDGSCTVEWVEVT